MNELFDRLASLSPSKRELLVRLLQKKSGSEPIAIVGMACRLPGAPDLESYWRLIIEGRSAVTEVPASRWDVDRFYSEVEAPGKMTTRWGAFVDGVDQFDPAFFGITPREASRMDPQQRLLLEVTWEALENALIPSDQIAGEKVGVFVGIGGTDYSKIPSHYRDYFEQIDAHVGTGNALSIAANRLSYILNLQGPSLAVDTACSSGLIATHLAIQSLRRGESDAALAGGVNLILSPETTIAFSKARMLSPDGVCRPFDAGANGYVRGEGCGMLLLKRLDDARRNRDPILAVLRGSAANQDGRTSGITAPNGESQKLLIRTALEDAGLTLDDISYIEAHGTGTPLGDPIEIRALADLFRRDREEQALCRFASVKGNIGHTETVSGVAGLIKTVLMMQHGVIPPQANFTSVNPHIDLAGTRLEVAAEETPWGPDAGRRVAGVSSFGFGGANVHLLVEASGEPALEPSAEATREPALHLLPLSARTPQALQALCDRHADSVEKVDDGELVDYCSTAANGRSTFNHRAAIVASTSRELATTLRSLAKGEPEGRFSVGQADGTKRPKLAFLYTGQGSQQPGMGRSLYETEPMFRAALDECDALLRGHLQTPLLEVLYGDEAGNKLNETAYTQPALFAVQYALTSLWKSWGVAPDLVLGHSVGEYAAACVTGVMSLADSLKLIATRGALIGQLPREGRMASLRIDGRHAREEIERHRRQVDIAALNGPESTVLSGVSADIEALTAQFETQGVATQMLNVSHAFHSPLMEPVLADFQAVAEQVSYTKPTATFISTLLADRIENGELNAEYWRRHIRDAVRFEEGMNRLMEEEPQAIIEIGPAPQLLGMARRFVDREEVAWLPSLRPGVDDNAVMLKSAAELYACGVKINCSPQDTSRRQLSVRLPNYPFQRQRLWLDIDESRRGTPGGGRDWVGDTPIVHPFLGHQHPLAGDRVVYEGSYTSEDLKYLQDHRVQGSAVMPAAGFLEQALAVGRLAFGEERFEISSLAIDQALFLADSLDQRIQTHVLHQSGVVSLSVYSGRLEKNADSEEESTEPQTVQWKRHATAELLPLLNLREPQVFDVTALQSECFDHQTSDDFYQIMDARGLSYGQSFRGLGEVRRGARHAVAEVRLLKNVAEQVTGGGLHPILGDACLQATAAVVPLEPDGGYCPSTYMPTRLDNVRLDGDPLEGTHIYVRRTAPESNDPRPESIVADIWLLDKAGKVLGEFHGARMLRVDRHAADASDELRQALHQVAWVPAPLAPAMDGSLGPEGAMGNWILIANELADGKKIASDLAEQLKQRNGRCQVLVGDSSNDLENAISNAGDELRGVIDLAAVTAPLDGADDSHIRRALAITQSLARANSAKAPSLCFVTRGAHAIHAEKDEGVHTAVSPTASALWGFGRVLANEHPEFNCRLIDLEVDGKSEDGALSVLFEVLSGGDERQIAIRDGARFAARLQATPEALAQPAVEEFTLPERSPAYRVELKAAGSFDGMTVRPLKRTQPTEEQVEIEVGATGLNFSDVLKALGLYPGIKDEVVPIGIECAGVVKSVGEGVTRFAVGDRVMGVAPYSFGSHATTAEHALTRIPDHLSDEEAATIPIAFLTAYHALVRLAGLSEGERVLIHAGAGGVGLAAIQIAQHVGAKIYTTAGSDEKRDHLRSLGVQHVYDSRSLEFADQIRRDTQHAGVDVVLNSLPGPAIRESLRLLSAYGRFLEIGKTDIYADRALGLSPFQDNLSYFAIDLDRVLRQRGDYIRGLFAEVTTLFEEGALRPLEFTRFEFAETREAFRYMAQRKNIGKVVVTRAESGKPKAEGDNRQIATEAFDGAWLVTGGLGSLGLQVAAWLADRGTPRIGLLSRGEPSETASEAIRKLNHRGVEVIPLRGDVLDKESLACAIERLQADDDKPLTGVVHAAGVLDDGVLYEMTPKQLQRAMTPKTTGAWNLHEATLDSPVREFILFSSIACQLGSPGQANYAAGNAFLDGLAHRRRSLGLPARSINWGPWAAGGMAVADGRDEALAMRGMHLLQPQLAFAALDRMLASEATQLSVMLPDWPQLLAGVRQIPSLLREIASVLKTENAVSAGVDQQLRNELLASTKEDRETRLQEFFLDQLAKIMGLAASEVDPTQPLNTLGLDSLMAIELKNNVETRLGVVLPMARFMEGPSASDLAEQVALLLSEETSSAVAPIASDDFTSGEEKKSPLSRGQQALWFLHQLSPESTAYNIADAVRIRGPLSWEALEKTIADLVTRHGAFRTTFHNYQGRPYQTVHANRPTPLELVDAADWTEAQISERVTAEVHKPFDLENGPLLRVVILRHSAREHVMLFALHHIIADFWSLVACTEEFRQLYDHHANDQPLALTDLRLGYGEFTRWQSKLLESEQGERHWEYWSEQLTGELPVLQLPTDRPRPPLQTYSGTLAFRWLDKQLTTRLKTLAEERGATLNMVLLAGYQLLLHRYSGQDDLVVGLPTSGRSRAEFSPVVGYFVNPVPVRSDLSQNPSFEDYLEQVRQRTLGALEHQDFPFPELVDRLHVDRDPSRSALFQALFVMQRAQVMHDQGLTPFLMGQSGASLPMAGLTFESMTLEQWVAQFDVSLAASEADGGVSLGLQYNTDLFDAATIESMLDAYERLLTSALDQPTAPVGGLKVLSQHDSAKLAEWNATARTPADGRPVHERFAAQAAKTPSATALVCGERSLTYGELNESANRLARRLVAAGIGRGSRVGLCLPRSVELIVGMYATLKAGAAYVPLDPSYPKSRIDSIIAAAGMTTVIARSEHETLLHGSSAPVVWVDREAAEIAKQSADELQSEVSRDDLIYVIFTSGSTGEPKGAGVTHRGFANLVDWYCEDLKLGPDDRALVVTSHGFDLTQKNFYATLAVGGQLHLSTTEVYDPEPIRQEIAQGGVTLFNATPSNFYPLVDPRAADTFPLLQSLRFVVLGGESIDLVRLKPWKDTGAKAAVINSYGPTECSDVVARYWVQDEDYQSNQPVPIGSPIGNVFAEVLDSRRQPMPIGATGELCLGGACLGVGYVNDAALTTEKFVDLPTGERAYLTGDLCRRRDDGEIEFVGRADHQVKVRGFRIELGDIEQALVEHPGVVESIVIVDAPSPDAKRLVGYAAVAPGEVATPGDLRAYLSERLPPHMVPAAIVLMEELPRTPHGKLDRRRLPTPDEVASSHGGGVSDFVPPNGPQESLLADVWADVLHTERIGRHDNFFDLGGDSLRSIEVVARLAGEGWRSRPADLLQCQTIAELAPRMTQTNNATAELTTGAAPLLPIQQWFFESNFSAPSHFNQSLLLETPPGLDAGAIARACDVLAQTHEALRLQFEKEDEGWRQVVTAESRLAYRHESFEGDDESLNSVIQEVQTSFDLENGPLATLAFFDAGPDHPGKLFFSLHHLITDPYSTRLLLEDLQSAYFQAITGREVVLPSPATTFGDWSRELARVDVAAEAHLWESMLAGAESQVPGDSQEGENDVASAETITIEWGETETRQLLDHRAEPSVVLLAAIAETLSVSGKSTSLLIDVERLGRESLDPQSLVDPSRTAGWLVSMHPFAIEPGKNSASTLETIESSWRSIPHQGMGYGLLRYRDNKYQQLPRPDIRFNYLGSMQVARGAMSDAFKPLTLATAGERHLNDRRTHLWELDFALRSGRLVLEWTYSRNRHSSDQMQALASRLQQAVEGLS